MSASAERPATRRRLAAVAAICMVVLALALGMASILDDAQRFTVQAPLLLVALLAAWYAITRAGRVRLIGMVVCVAAVAGIVAYAFVEGPAAFVVALIRIVLLLAAVVFARHALALDIGALKGTPTAGEPVPASKRGVLIVNPKSGGGKAERFHLEEESRARGSSRWCCGPATICSRWPEMLSTEAPT